ncbi:MAG: hypothetical protein KGI80_04585 [Verrucomicrobiota bacterium]|nr:hypothetical protein [Verrucomicrobiota bacterium]
MYQAKKNNTTGAAIPPSPKGLGFLAVNRMKIALLSASGIGDCLLLATLGYSLKSKGWDVTLYSDHAGSFGAWLGGIHSRPQLPLEQIPDLSSFDALFLQHDNSPRARAVQLLSHHQLYRFFGAHVPEKHGLLIDSSDYICDRKVPMAENVGRAAKKFFNLSLLQTISSPFPNLRHRRFSKRILIHPTASSAAKCWPRQKFFALKSELEKRGLHCTFITAPNEKKEWGAEDLPTLEALASFLYESGGCIGNDSGPGHLASLLQIPHLVIGGDGRQMPLWQPGWFPGALLTPPPFLMRFKLFQKRWGYFIKPKDVANKFIETIDL